MNGQVEKSIELGRSYTLAMIESDIKAGDINCLYFVEEEEINLLIDRGRIDEDYAHYYQQFQEELRYLKAEC